VKEEDIRQQTGSYILLSDSTSVDDVE